jgi:1,4-alpha-glucan branching enzyme
MSREQRLGAITLEGDRTSFRVWAPRSEQVEVEITSPTSRRVLLGRDEDGYHHGVIDGVGAGARYLYRRDGEKTRPDPAS